MQKLILIMIRGYQRLISPLLPPVCRFYPSCSQYSLEAYQKFGLFHGTRLSIIRLLKCHPFHPGGIDRVPENIEIDFKQRFFRLNSQKGATWRITQNFFKKIHNRLFKDSKGV